MSAAPPTLDAWMAEQFPAVSDLSPTDIALTMVKRRLRQHPQLVAFCGGNAERIVAFSDIYDPGDDFSLVPGCVSYPDTSLDDPAAGVVLSEVKLIVCLRSWFGMSAPLADWRPGLSTLRYSIYRWLLADQQLRHQYVRSGEPGTWPLADRCDFGAALHRRDRTPENRVAESIALPLTYQFSIDPETGLPWNLSTIG